MKKLVLVLSVLLLATIQLFAAGAQEKASQEEVTLSVMWFNDANESDVFMDTIADYLAENPHVKIDMQVVAFSDYEQKLKLMISGGNPPDVARVTNNHLAALISSLEPIEGYVDDVKAVETQFMPASVAFAKDDKGILRAYPTEATANGMIVNKTAFDNAGIDVAKLSETWTWDQWEEAARKVIAANDKIKYGLAVDFTPHRFSTLMFQMGGRFMNSEQSAMQFNNPGTLAAIETFKRYHDTGLIPKSVWLGSENPAELFQAGIVASHIGGSWNINTYNQNVKDFEWIVVHNPKGAIVSSVPGGKFIASFKDSKNKEEAQRLMAVFSDKTHNEQYCRDTFNLSARVDSEVQYPSNSEDFARFQIDLTKTPAFTANEWKHPVVNKVSTYIREQVVEVLIGNISAQEAVKRVDERAATFF
ncbi:MAG TPA: sugar ABC transporter substrate-binding protein [Sphaerochaeta sp.]|nr:sugar ABC transporter substrate-binding protein [Sphaerochaeta sp.]